MCIICEGTSFEDQLRLLRSKFEQFGWTSISVEADDRSPSWAYTIGMIRAGHPELVVTDEPPDVAGRLFETLASQVLAGRTLAVDSTFEFDGRTWVVIPVHRSKIRAGMLAWWPDIFPHCPCHSEPDAVQVIDVEVLHRPGAREGTRLDQGFETSAGRAGSRAERRRRDRAETKRRRRR